MGEIKPEDQTHDEWIADLNGEEPPLRSIPTNNDAPDLTTDLMKNLFRYIDHNTTCLKAVALRFESLDGKTEAVKFYNVNLKGTKKSYPAKHLGQFNSTKRGKFRKFWMNCVGKAPYRWSRVHKSMRSALSGLIFECSYEVAKDKKGQLFNRIKEIMLYDMAQGRHEMGTSQARIRHETIHNT